MPFLTALEDFVPPPSSATKIAMGTPVNPVIRSYTLKVAVQNRCLNFYYYPSPPLPVRTADQAMDMRVSEPCQIELNLDADPISGLSWYFPQQADVITLGSSDIPNPGSRYSNLKFSLDPLDGKCRKLAFDAAFLVTAADPARPGKTLPNRDQFNVIVKLDQILADGRTPATQPLVLFIDPGLKNPGDDTQ